MSNDWIFIAFKWRYIAEGCRTNGLGVIAEKYHCIAASERNGGPFFKWLFPRGLEYKGREITPQL